MKKILKLLFNNNTGYFIKVVLYPYEDKVELGYIVCRGYRYFGIFGYDRIAYCYDKENLNDALNLLNIKLNETKL